MHCYETTQLKVENLTGGYIAMVEPSARDPESKGSIRGAASMGEREKIAKEIK
jgi:hypothetical protein